jgi:hypothetical protein
VGGTVLWVGENVIYGVGEHPERNAGAITLNTWL